jgi:thiol:disulfide interchange protein DsbA
MTQMNPDRRLVAAALAAAPCLAALPALARAQAGGALVENKDYTRLTAPQQQGTPGKVEVLEFFSYACPHCASFEPVLHAWSRQLPPEIALRRVPVPFLAAAELLQRTYYALETSAMLETVHPKIFTALHVEKQRPTTPEDMAQIVAKAGGDAGKYLAAYKSFGVAGAVAKAKRLATDYSIQAVPSLAVGGRFITSPSQAGSSERALAVVETLAKQSPKG